VFSIRYDRIRHILQDIFIANVEAARYVVFVQKGRSWRVGVGVGVGRPSLATNWVAK
jgi:hypothetical protein